MPYLSLTLALPPLEPSFRLGRMCFGGSGGFTALTETIFPSPGADGKLGSLWSSSTWLSGGGSSALFPPKKYKSRKTPRHTASATTLQWILMVEKFSARSATHWNGHSEVQMNGQNVFRQRCHAPFARIVTKSQVSQARLSAQTVHEFAHPREEGPRRCTVIHQSLRPLEKCSHIMILLRHGTFVI